MAEVKTIFNRANRQELEAVGSGAGSLYQRASGLLNSWTEGQPISPQLLKDTAAMADVMSQAAKRAYDYNIAINKATHGGNPQPVDLSRIAPVTTPLAAPGELPAKRTVKMRAPVTGMSKPEEMDVPEDQVEHYKKKGATVVR